jgi:hypothetical protein
VAGLVEANNDKAVILTLSLPKGNDLLCRPSIMALLSALIAAKFMPDNRKSAIDKKCQQE